MNLCDKTGKEGLLSRSNAKERLRHLKARSEGYSSGEVYLCESCGLWHVGRAKIYTNKNRDRMKSGKA